MEDGLLSLLIVPAVAVAAPPLAALVGRYAKVPLVVFEIVLGILVGPAVLGWVQPNDFLDMLSQFGLAVLFFMAGNEIDFATIAGRPLKRAGLGWVVSLAGGIALGVIIGGDLASGVFIGVALCSTALGTILPALRDAGELPTPFGRAVTATGAAGEFGPLIAISLFLSGRSPLPATIVLLVFVGVSALAIWYASNGKHSRLHTLVTATLHTSGQFAVRLVLLGIASLVVLSIVLGLDMLLGAFAAGVVWRVFVARATPADHRVIETKLDAVAFGFLVPIFFVSSGVTFDLQALTTQPATLVLVPLFLVLLLVVRGLPSLLASPPGATRADRRGLLLFGATGLPIIIAVTTIGVESTFLPADTATALVGAGMLSVLLFPALALVGRAQRTREVGADVLDETP
ncbi:cation:proton antiporter [Plantibacter flavus]